jgi:hypothetical protein
VIHEEGFHVYNMYNIVEEYFCISIAPVRIHKLILHIIRFMEHCHILKLLGIVKGILCL